MNLLKACCKIKILIDKEKEYLDLSIKRFEDLKKDIEEKGKQKSLKMWETNGKS